MRVFLYGSLMRNGYAEWRMAECSWVAAAETADGFALVDLGDYPGMVRAEGGRVLGEIWEAPEHALPALDAYEDHPDLYLRQEIELSDGSQAQAWLYRDATRPGVPVPSGDWRTHIARREGSA